LKWRTKKQNRRTPGTTPREGRQTGERIAQSWAAASELPLSRRRRLRRPPPPAWLPGVLLGSATSSEGSLKRADQCLASPSVSSKPPARFAGTSMRVARESHRAYVPGLDSSSRKKSTTLCADWCRKVADTLPKRLRSTSSLLRRLLLKFPAVWRSSHDDEEKEMHLMPQSSSSNVSASSSVVAAAEASS